MRDALNLNKKKNWTPGGPECWVWPKQKQLEMESRNPKRSRMEMERVSLIVDIADENYKVTHSVIFTMSAEKHKELAEDDPATLHNFLEDALRDRNRLKDNEQIMYINEFNGDE